jgi:hypothetical protein
MKPQVVALLDLAVSLRTQPEQAFDRLAAAVDVAARPEPKRLLIVGSTYLYDGPTEQRIRDVVADAQRAHASVPFELEFCDAPDTCLRWLTGHMRLFEEEGIRCVYHVPSDANVDEYPGIPDQDIPPGRDGLAMLYEKMISGALSKDVAFSLGNYKVPEADDPKRYFGRHVAFPLLEEIGVLIEADRGEWQDAQVRSEYYALSRGAWELFRGTSLSYRRSQMLDLSAAILAALKTKGHEVDLVWLSSVSDAPTRNAADFARQVARFASQCFVTWQWLSEEETKAMPFPDALKQAASKHSALARIAHRGLEQIADEVGTAQRAATAGGVSSNA